MKPKHENQLKIYEIFHSLQGESNTAGWRTVFVRLTGCPLRCSWCDTEYAFYGGAWLDFEQIIEQVKQHQTPHVCVTGGEPLAQKKVHVLLDKLIELDYQVSLETSGALSVARVNPKVQKVIDVKTPGSGEVRRNLYRNFDYLNQQDQLKFVIDGAEDYQWSKDLLYQHRLHEKCDVLFSPVSGKLSATDLADWIVDDQLPVRFQLQLHKLLWGDAEGK